MDELIEALQIFKKYIPEDKLEWPTACEHDTLHIKWVEHENISLEDWRRLEAIGFIYDEMDDAIFSYRFGS